MLAGKVNGFTAAKVDSAIRGTAGKMESNPYFKILDRHNNELGYTTNVVSGSIRHDTNQRGKRPVLLSAIN
jgi:hypothetical protein